MYSIPEPNLDPPEDRIYSYCSCCHGEIYEGEFYYNIDGQMIHTDCLSDFANSYFSHCVALDEGEMEV